MPKYTPTIHVHRESGAVVVQWTSPDGQSTARYLASPVALDSPTARYLELSPQETLDQEEFVQAVVPDRDQAPMATPADVKTAPDPLHPQPAYTYEDELKRADLLARAYLENRRDPNAPAGIPHPWNLLDRRAQEEERWRAVEYLNALVTAGLVVDPETDPTVAATRQRENERAGLIAHLTLLYPSVGVLTESQGPDHVVVHVDVSSVLGPERGHLRFNIGKDNVNWFNYFLARLPKSDDPEDPRIQADHDDEENNRRLARLIRATREARRTQDDEGGQ